MKQGAPYHTKFLAGIVFAIRVIYMLLNDYLQRETIDLELKSSSKERILAELVDLLVKTGIISQGEAMLEMLLEREGLGSTGIGHGVAIPHGRSEEITQPAVVFGRSREEVDFDSIDGRPARIFFLLIAPENGGNDHLHLLAKIARLMKNPQTREKLLELQTPDEVLELIKMRDMR